MAADRLVTVGEAFLNIEMDRKKIVQLTPRVWLTITGTVQDAEYARDRFTQASHLFAGQSVLQIAKRLRKACEHIRRRQIEERIIKPGIGVTYAEFSKACLSNQTTPLMSDAFNKINNFNFDLELMLVGIDDSGAHLYRINCFYVNSHEGLAFTTIGVGRTIAAAVIASYEGSTLSLPIAETIYRVYEAKRASEQTNLVGGLTDMLLLRQGSEPTLIPQQSLDVLANIYDKRKKVSLSAGELSDITNSIPTITRPHSPEAPESTKHGRPRQRRRRASGP